MSSELFLIVINLDNLVSDEFIIKRTDSIVKYPYAKEFFSTIMKSGLFKVLLVSRQSYEDIGKTVLELIPELLKPEYAKYKKNIHFAFDNMAYYGKCKCYNINAKTKLIYHHEKLNRYWKEKNMPCFDFDRTIFIECQCHNNFIKRWKWGSNRPNLISMNNKNKADFIFYHLNYFINEFIQNSVNIDNTSKLKMFMSMTSYLDIFAK